MCIRDSRYSDMVYRLAFARTGNTADAEDVYQEVFLRYLRSDPQFTSEEPVSYTHLDAADDLLRDVQSDDLELVGELFL